MSDGATISHHGWLIVCCYNPMSGANVMEAKDFTADNAAADSLVGVAKIIECLVPLMQSLPTLRSAFQFISDTAADEMAAGRELEKKFKFISANGCWCHLGQRILGKVGEIKEIKILVEEVKSIVKFFLNKHAPFAIFSR